MWLAQPVCSGHPRLMKGEQTMTSAENLERIVDYIADHYSESITIEDLERIAGVSRFSISRQFHRVFQVSPMRWIWRFRVTQAANVLVRYPAMPCRDVAFLCGFETPSHFNRLFRNVVGCSPGLFRSTTLKSECNRGSWQPQRPILTLRSTSVLIPRTNF